MTPVDTKSSHAPETPDANPARSPSATAASQGERSPSAAYTVEVVRNSYPNPEANGKDLFEARIAERPGLTAFGATEEEARALALTTAAEDFRRSSPARKGRLRTLQALVQFNHRITPEDAEAIARRAESVGLSIRQFMLNQLLRAPIVQPLGKVVASQADHDKLWAKMAAGAKQPNDPTCTR